MQDPQLNSRGIALEHLTRFACRILAQLREVLPRQVTGELGYAELVGLVADEAVWRRTVETVVAHRLAELERCLAVREDGSLEFIVAAAYDVPLVRLAELRNVVQALVAWTELTDEEIQRGRAPFAHRNRAAVWANFSDLRKAVARLVELVRAPAGADFPLAMPERSIVARMDEAQLTLDEVDQVLVTENFLSVFDRLADSTSKLLGFIDGDMTIDGVVLHRSRIDELAKAVRGDLIALIDELESAAS